ncbi:MAG: tRNA (N6-threonylcarbamoyladenosine(37)-N6)-methyltransferase TrmO [Thermodesulfobacteriota bacterium]|nr:tRNA (N6-threonylcarbamoyladenosine(37)-N6)-methyltransferase TrmO [Thermodesulfobacteriota bacterium]
MKICFKPIGVMHCDNKTLEKIPKFYTESSLKGKIEIHDPFIEGIKGLEEVDHIVVIFLFHLSRGYTLLQRRRGYGRLQGVFSLCSPMRPNPIGMSVLRLTKVDPPFLYVENVDMVDGTPVLDIKPYLPGRI